MYVHTYYKKGLSTTDFATYVHIQLRTAHEWDSRNRFLFWKQETPKHQISISTTMQVYAQQMLIMLYINWDIILPLAIYAAAAVTVVTLFLL